MRIVICTDTIGDLNGVSRFIQDMAELSQSEALELHVVTSTLKPCPRAPNIHNTRPRMRIRMPFYSELDLVFASKKRLEAKILELDPDILHVSTPGPVGMLANRIARRYRIPTMGTYHTDFPAYIHDQTRSKNLKRVTDRVMQRFYSNFHHVFSRSREYLGIMEKDIAIAKSRSSFLKPGTNLERFSPHHCNRDIFSQFDIPEASFYLLYVGRISKEKNVPFLLQVWKRLKKRCPRLDARLILAGEGTMITQAQTRMAPLGVHFLGGIRDAAVLSQLYASSDLFLFPSLTDTLGQVVMEAQASRVACIVSDQGGPQSIVGYNSRMGGRILSTANPDIWAEAILNLLKDATLRQEFAQNGWENMKGFDIRASFRHFIATHRKVYEKLTTE